VVLIHRARKHTLHGFSTFEIAEANNDDETIKTETDEEKYGPLK